jgi:hypothetical protein
VNYRRSLVAASVGLLASACAAPEPRTPVAACAGETVGLALGFERAVVGHNDLPLAVYCGVRSGEPAPPPTYVEATFAAPAAPPGTLPVKAEVLHRPAARVLGTGPLRVQFDYLLRVTLDQPGTWLLHLRTKVPWRPDEAFTTLPVSVEARGAALD